MDSEVLVFVEVRTRSSNALVQGFHSVDTPKKRTVLRACKAYLKSLRVKPHTYRFDIVEVELYPDENYTISHHENIPLFPKGFQSI